MTDQPKENTVTKKRSEQILTKVWELADRILENKDDVVENDARFGVKEIPVPADADEIEASFRA